MRSTILSAAFALAVLAAPEAHAQFNQPIYNINPYAYYFRSYRVDLQIAQINSIDTTNPRETVLRVLAVGQTQVQEVRIAGLVPTFGVYYLFGYVRPITHSLMLEMCYEFMTNRGAYSALHLEDFERWNMNTYSSARSTSRMRLVSSSPYQPPSDVGVGGGITSAMVQDQGTHYGHIIVRRSDGRDTLCHLLRTAATFEGVSRLPLTEMQVLDIFQTAFDGIPFIKFSLIQKLMDDTRIVHAGSIYHR